MQWGGLESNKKRVIKTSLENPLSSPPWDDVEGLTFIVYLFVAPDKRGRGIGYALVGAALAAVGGREVGLRVESENAAARKIYERHGFAVR